MSYELKKPINQTERDSFIVNHNHRNGLRIEDTEMYLFALEPNEIMGEKEIEIETPDYEIAEEEYEEPVYNEETGEIDRYKTHTREISRQIGTHTETITIPYPVINPNYEQEQAQKEAVRIANLHLTRGDVFRALLLAKGVTRSQIREILEAMPEETHEQRTSKELALIDFDEALEFYRGVNLINLLGTALEISLEKLDRFFDTNDWHVLI